MRWFWLLLPLAGCGRAPADPRGIDRDEVLLQVAATGRAEARPDEARFLAGVQSVAASAGVASRTNAAAMNRVTAALRGLGVKPDDLQTRALTLGRIDYGPQRGRFEANNQVEVRIRDLARAGEAIAAVTEAGANVLSGPNLAVGDPEAANRSAYAAAYRAARARAETYAGAAELKIARVLAIRDGTAPSDPLPYGFDMAREASAPRPVSAPPINAGVTTSEVLVRVDFALSR